MKPVVFLLFFLSTEYGALNLAIAKDFGIHGHSFEIEEPDLLKEMEGKLKRLEEQGKLENINETLMKRAQNSLSHPSPVAGITKAVESRTFFYDPSITVPYDLKDHEGRVFHKAGTKLNPLEFHSLPAPLVFIDGKDKAQVSWVENVYLKTSLKTSLKTNQRPKIILTSGSPFQLMEQWQTKSEQAELDQDNPDQDNLTQKNPALKHLVEDQPPQNNSAQNNFGQAQLVGDYPRQDNPVYFDQGGKLTEKLGIRHVPAVVVQEGLKLKISEIVVEEDESGENRQ